MDSIVNIRLLARPANWVKVFLMVFIAIIGVSLVGQYFKQAKSAPAQ